MIPESACLITERDRVGITSAWSDGAGCDKRGAFVERVRGAYEETVEVL